MSKTSRQLAEGTSFGEMATKQGQVAWLGRHLRRVRRTLEVATICAFFGAVVLYFLAEENPTWVFTPFPEFAGLEKLPGFFLDGGYIVRGAITYHPVVDYHWVVLCCGTGVLTTVAAEWLRGLEKKFQIATGTNEEEA